MSFIPIQLAKEIFCWRGGGGGDDENNAVKWRRLRPRPKLSQESLQHSPPASPSLVNHGQASTNYCRSKKAVINFGELET